MSHRRLTVTIASTLTAGGLGASAAAAPAATTSFAGSCAFNSAAALQTGPEGVGATMGPVAATIAGPGDCDGTLNGRHVTEKGSVLVLRVTGRASCFASDGPLSGPGTITIADTVLPIIGAVTLDGTRFAARFEVRGTTSGQGVGDGSLDFLSSALPNPITDGGIGCFNRTQRKSVFDLPFTTSSTLVSTTPDAAPAATPARTTKPRKKAKAKKRPKATRPARS